MREKMALHPFKIMDRLSPYYLRHLLFEDFWGDAFNPTAINHFESYFSFVAAIRGKGKNREMGISPLDFP